MRNGRYFYVTLALLGASLAACTATRQWPAVKVAQRWRFQSTAKSVVKQALDKGKAEVWSGRSEGMLGCILARQKGRSEVNMSEGGVMWVKVGGGRVMMRITWVYLLDGQFS